MKTNRKALHDILQAVRPGVASKEVVENATSFIFSEGRVLTYNDEICVSHPVDFDLTGAVQAKEFLALLGKLGDEDIDLEVTKAELVVRGVKTRAGIRLEANTNIEEINAMLGNPTDWNVLPETLRPSVDFCAFSVGRDQNRPMLTGIYIGGQHTMSSDNERITMCDLGENVDIKPFVLPAVAARELKAFLPVEYAFSTGWVHFRTKDDVMFSSRILEGKYPVEQILKYMKETVGEKVQLPTTLISALERTGIFTSKDSVRVTLSDGFLVTRGEGDSGWCEETSRIRYHGPKLRFEVSPDFLKSVLEHTQEAIIGTNMLKFSGLGFEHIMCVKAMEASEELEPEPSTNSYEEPEFNPDDEIPF